MTDYERYIKPLTYHVPSSDATRIMIDTRRRFIALQQFVLDNCPASSIKTEALDHIRCGLMSAIQSIAVYDPESVEHMET